MHMEHVISWQDFSFLLNINTLTLLQNINLFCKFIFCFVYTLLEKLWPVCPRVVYMQVGQYIWFQLSA